MSEDSPYVEFLTPKEVQVLTGFKVRKKQIEQLKLQGIPFRLNGQGAPIVLRQSLMGGKKLPSSGQVKERWQSPILRNI